MERRRRIIAAILVCFALNIACGRERPPGAEEFAQKNQRLLQESSSASAEPVFLDPKADAYVLTFAGERGKLGDTSNLESVPEEAQGMVRVHILNGTKPPAGSVWVANLQQAQVDGRYKLETVPREMFEELAMGQGMRSTVKLPEGIEAPEVIAPSEEVIVYKTEWCGVCKQLQAYLDRKGVTYVAKDIEKDSTAAAELKGKAQAQGLGLGSVPVVDVRGKLLVGFDRKKLEALL